MPIILFGFICQKMYLSELIYTWLVSRGVIPNTGEIDEQGNVGLPAAIVNSFDNGVLMRELMRKISETKGSNYPEVLDSVKQGHAKNIRTSNWNFIWLGLDAYGVKVDSRIKELILQGEHALVVDLIGKLYEKDQFKEDVEQIEIKRKVIGKKTVQTVDIKRIDMTRDPEDSESALEFLVLLLKAALGMRLEDILGLFTNQNKYLAHIFVKGVNQNFDPIVLFFSLLGKHSKKLRAFCEQDSLDAQACLIALKTGFISRNERVVSLTIQIFGKMGNIYRCFVSEESKCASMMFLGVKRHPVLRQSFWNLLLHIIDGEELAFFTRHYSNCFQDPVEQIEITTYLVRYIASSAICDELNNTGVISNWLDNATKLSSDNIDAQIICFQFIGEIMLYLPSVIEQNDDSFFILERKWYAKTLPEFTILFNELVVILEKLGEGRNTMAKKVYLLISQIANNIGQGDKRDYLVENFMPLVRKFPTIPSQYIIQHLKRTPLSNAQFLLVCQCIEYNQGIETSISIGNFLKNLFLEHPLVNFYMGTLLKELVQRVISDSEHGVPFYEKLLDEYLKAFANLEIKYKLQHKQNSPYFGRKLPAQKGSKQEEEDMAIKQKEKLIILSFIMSTTNIITLQDNQDLNKKMKEKMLNTCSFIKSSNHKAGSKALEDALLKKLKISKEEQSVHYEEYIKKASLNNEEEAIRRSKISSQLNVASKLKAPSNITKQFQQMTEKRKKEEQEKKLMEAKQKQLQEKKRISVKKELQIANLLRGQIGQAQLRQFGSLERLIQQQKELQIFPLGDLQQRQIEAIQSLFKAHHKVLRHLFVTYTWTMHNNHANEKFQDNQQRKEILTSVELNRLLKDYRLAFLTNPQQVNGLVKDINMKLLNRRQINELDYNGFEQFIVQFCALIMTRNHTVTTTTPEGKVISQRSFKNEPVHVILREFFAYLKTVFIARGEKVAMFQDNQDASLSQEQQRQLQEYTEKVEKRPSYILPKGYKKVACNTFQFHHRLTESIKGIPQSYAVSLEILSDILASAIGVHLVENIIQRKNGFKVKLVKLANPQMTKVRAMSTYIERKSQLAEEKEYQKRRSSSKVVGKILEKLPAEEKKIGEVAASVLEDIIQKLDEPKEKGKQKEKEKEKQKQNFKTKKIVSSKRIQELERSKLEKLQKKMKEKEEQKQALLLKEKEEQKKRRQQTQRFLESQKIKIAQKRRKQEEEKLQKQRLQDEKQVQMSQLKQKFKAFHQGQYEKIKKIEYQALEKIQKKKNISQYEKEEENELKIKLRQKIGQQDKRIIDLRKQGEKNIRTLFESQAILNVFSKYEPNLKSLYDFLIHNTYLSLTGKKHNNQIIFETWRNFLSLFELSIIVPPKETTFIFKSLTKNKLVTKDYHIGLNYRDFQEALLRIAIKYKNIFNLVSERIKDKSDLENSRTSKIDIEGEKKQKDGEIKEVNSTQKPQNEFENVKELNIKEMIKESLQSKGSIQEYADTSLVTDKTLLGVIYYIKVPNSKAGQQARFRELLANQHPTFVNPSQRLKQKLSEEYTLDFPQPKKMPKKIIGKNKSSKMINE